MYTPFPMPLSFSKARGWSCWWPSGSGGDGRGRVRLRPYEFQSGMRQEPRPWRHIQSSGQSSSLFCWDVVCRKEILTNAKRNTNIAACSAVQPYLFNVHPHLMPHADWYGALWTEKLPCARHGKYSGMTAFILCSCDLHTALKCLQLKDMLFAVPIHWFKVIKAFVLGCFKDWAGQTHRTFV